MLLILLPFSIITAIVIYTTQKNRNPKPIFFWLLFSSIMSVAWIFLVANIILDFMTFITYISGLSRMFVSLSLLSLGNSLGDLFVDSALSKKGHGTMAISGVFSGQLLNLLIGFSLNLLFSFFKGRKTGKSEDTEFHLFNPEVFLMG